MKKLVCYCFGFSEQDILDDLETHGRSTILDKIISAKKANSCQCEAKHPQKR